MKKILASMMLVVFVFGCATVDTSKVIKEGESAYTLQLLHYADVDGNEEVALASVDEFSALVNAFTNDKKYGNSTLVLSSGDNIIPGQRFYAAEQKAITALTGSNEPGHFDIALMNAFNTKASALGNHELDASPKEFCDALKPKAKGGAKFSGAKFPYLSANIDFSTDEDTAKYLGKNGVDYSKSAGKLAAYTTVVVNGEKIGIVGASTPLLGTITSIGDMTLYPKSGMDIPKLAEKIQASVDALTNSGVNKIILLAHMQQISIEKQLARHLHGVDIIVAGGSNTRMGDKNDTLFTGDKGFEEAYPYITATKDEKPIVVVNVDGDYKYLGRLVVDFDKNGEMLLGNLDNTVNGAWASTADNVKNLNAKPIPEVVKLQKAMQTIIKKQFGNVLGYTSVYLDGRRSQVRTQETNLGDLSADANLWYANLMAKEHVDISFKNGGGIRTEIGTAIVPPGTNNTSKIIYKAPAASKENGTKKGAITEGHMKAVLRFDNGLVTLSLTAEELKMILEHAVAGAGAGKTPGAFPQIAGMHFVFDITKKAGNRVTKLQIVDENGKVKDTVIENGKIKGDAKRRFRMVTLNFLANGGDDYPFATLSKPERRNLYAGKGYGDAAEYPTENINKDPGKNSSFSKTGGEQDAIAEYLQAHHATEKTAYSKQETPRKKDVRIRY
ncbi:MAG: bifunctional metallophosphatase/5'-nucleotidase [Treponema sp.]|nr:MAG: bifunctional metallophosphatase/5'-nucleotidase [Treponema sp.]